nr:esterase-like activity of phytase family protein [Altericroceibacterium indicum]
MGVWQLASDAREFGGYSSLLAMPDGQFQTYSDFGWRLRFSAPGAPQRPARLDHVPTDRKLLKKWQSDIESATRDPKTGDIWLGYEGMNMIRRHSAANGKWASVHPPEMAHWPHNSGAESLLRLADGRFIVMSEGGTGPKPAPSVGLLYDHDPVEGGTPLIFGLAHPKGYRSTDMAQLPDGRVLILLRDFDPPFPPIFRSRLLIADPATIKKGQYWHWQTLLDFASPIPSENYEGLAVRDLGGGLVDLWMISDDNQAVLQQTLLLQIRWDMGQAKGKQTEAAATQALKMSSAH